VYAETAGGISAGPGVGPGPPGARLGGEYTIAASATAKVHVRLGFAYESSAVPKAYESPLTVDGDKFTFAGGLGLTIDRTRIDATFAYVMMSDVDVDPAQAALAPIQPVSGYPAPSTPYTQPTYAQPPAAAPRLGPAPGNAVGA